MRRLLAEGASVIVADVLGLGHDVQPDFAEACREGRLFDYQVLGFTLSHADLQPCPTSCTAFMDT